MIGARSAKGRWLCVVLTAALLTSCRNSVPTIDHLTAGALLTDGGRALLPQGVQLRPAYGPGLKLTSKSEGWIPHLYNDVANYSTVGYGHLIKRAPCNGTEPDEFRKGLTEQQGSDLVVGDMATAQYTVMTLIHVPTRDGQFAALADFTFNVASTNFRDSTLLKTVNEEQVNRIAPQFRRWVLAGGKPWQGLQQRREAEIALFFEGQPKPRVVPEPGEKLSPIDIRRRE
jgi:lysozyme